MPATDEKEVPFSVGGGAAAQAIWQMLH